MSSYKRIFQAVLFLLLVVFAISSVSMWMLGVDIVTNPDYNAYYDSEIQGTVEVAVKSTLTAMSLEGQECAATVRADTITRQVPGFTAHTSDDLPKGTRVEILGFHQMNMSPSGEYYVLWYLVEVAEKQMWVFSGNILLDNPHCEVLDLDYGKYFVITAHEGLDLMHGCRSTVVEEAPYYQTPAVGTVYGHAFQGMEVNVQSYQDGAEAGEWYQIALVDAGDVYEVWMEASAVELGEGCNF